MPLKTQSNNVQRNKTIENTEIQSCRYEATEKDKQRNNKIKECSKQENEALRTSTSKQVKQSITKEVSNKEK